MNGHRRINGIGPVAAKVFYEAGYKSVTDIACANATVMLGVKLGLYGGVVALN